MSLKIAHNVSTMGSGGLRATFRSAERESQFGNPTLEHELHPPLPMSHCW